MLVNKKCLFKLGLAIPIEFPPRHIMYANHEKTLNEDNLCRIPGKGVNMSKIFTTCKKSIRFVWNKLG